MKYMGSKAKHAEEIKDVIYKEIKNFESGSYVEPFVGGGNMICSISRVEFERYGNDINPFLISMFQALQKGWIPPDSVDEQTYKLAMENSKLTFNATLQEKALIGFIGIGCSYSGKWFGGYARGNDNNGNPRNYCLESKKNVMKQMDKLTDVIFTSGNYWEMEFPSKSIIYCDPPYQNTTKYKDNFDHQKFWVWCEQKAKDGHKVFVSEYNAPKNWRCIWQKEVNSSLTKETGSKKGVEKLFTI